MFRSTQDITINIYKIWFPFVVSLSLGLPGPKIAYKMKIGLLSYNNNLYSPLHLSCTFYDWAVIPPPCSIKFKNCVLNIHSQHFVVSRRKGNMLSKLKKYRIIFLLLSKTWNKFNDKVAFCVMVHVIIILWLIEKFSYPLMERNFKIQ